MEYFFEGVMAVVAVYAAILTMSVVVVIVTATISIVVRISKEIIAGFKSGWLAVRGDPKTPRQ